MKMLKRVGLLVGAVALIAALLLFLLPAGVVVNQEGYLSISVNNTVLAVGSPSTNEVSGQAPQIEEELVEQVWMRTKNSKVFHSYGIPNKDYHDIYLDAVHYEVGYEREIETLEGPEIIYWTTWEDIDNTLESAGELSPWDWQMVKADYHVYMLEDFTYGQILKFEKADPFGVVLGDVAFQPMALQWTNDLDQIQEVSMPQSGVLSVVGNKIDWEDAYDLGIDFSWICSSTRLFKLLTISSLEDLPIPEQYILSGGNPVLELNLIFDPSDGLDIYVDGILWDRKSEVRTFNTVEFKLGDVTLWGFMPLQVWDSFGEDEISVVQGLRGVGKKLYVSMRLPYGWIQEATFPIYIDAVVDEQVETSSDDAHEVVSDGSIDLTDTIIDLGFYTGGPTHAGFRFTGIDTTDVEDISTAYLQFYPAQSDSRAVSYTWYGENVASATTFTTDAYNISNREKTTASVTEDPPATWASGTPVQTADLSSILNEVFSRGDWVSGNDLAILNIYNSGSGERRLRSWDYNDHSKAPRLHFENPTQVTYYFDGRSASAWTDPDNFDDGNIVTFASTSSDSNVHEFNSNTCPGTDLGTITKVQLRVHGKGDGNDQIELTPVFAGGDGDVHETVPVVDPGGWTSYVNITTDTNAPSPWTWAAVQALDCDAARDQVSKANTMYGSKVEIRVTYLPPLPSYDFDIGSPAIDRPASTAYGRTYVNKNNPASASGVLHTIEIYVASVSMTGLRVGTFYTTNGNTLKCRDSVLLGDASEDLDRFTELSITVVAGDYIGCYFDTGFIEESDSGYDGCWRVDGEYIDPNDEAEYIFQAGWAHSIRGYGDIDGAVPDITSAPNTWTLNGIVGDGEIIPDTIYYANPQGDTQAPASTVADADCRFTVTNSSTMAIDLTLTMGSFSGGDANSTNSEDGTNGATTYGAHSWFSGQLYANKVIIKSTGSSVGYDGLPATTDIKWGAEVETRTNAWTGGSSSTATLTITATVD